MKLEVAKLLKSANSQKPKEGKLLSVGSRGMRELLKQKGLWGAVYKRVEAEETTKYEARDEEATEMRDSQQCILSGGVYLRHHLEKLAFQKFCLLSFSSMSTTRQVTKR